MPTTSMNIRTDAEIKKQAEALFAEFGLNMTTAVNMFLRQSIRNQAIPLELSFKPNEIGKNEGHHIHKGEGNLDIFDLAGKKMLAAGYDYKSLREGANDSC